MTLPRRTTLSYALTLPLLLRTLIVIAYQIIPQIGVESAPSDLLAFSLASIIREQLSVGTKDIVATVYDIK